MVLKPHKPSKSKTTVLVTGVAGFIGSNLADRLLAEGGFRVIGIDNLSYGVLEQVPSGVEFHREDIRNASAERLFQGVDFVFHLAAKNCIADCQADPVETADINVSGSVRVFEASCKAKVRKVITAESSALYEASPVLPTPETEVRPQSFYALSKQASMLFADGYARFFGLPTTALRYFCVYGPRQDYRRTIPPVFSAFIINLLRGKRPTIYGTGEKRRDFIHVDDVNDFHILCMKDQRTTGQVFNLGSGENRSVNEIYTLIAGLIGSDIKPIHKPDMPAEALETRADIGRAMALGWKPRIGLEQGLATSIAFIKNELEKGRIL